MLFRSSAPAEIDVDEEQRELEKKENIVKIAPEQTILETQVITKHKIDFDDSGDKKYTLELKGKTELKQDFELHASLSEAQKTYSISINDFAAIYQCMLACIKNSCVFLCEKESVLDSNILLFEYFSNTNFGIKAKIIDLIARYLITVSTRDNFVTYRLYVDGNSLDGKHFSFKTSIGSDLEANERKYTIFKIGLYTKEEWLKRKEEKLVNKKRKIARERRATALK